LRDEQRSSSPNANISLYQFDDGFKQVYVDQPLPAVMPLWLVRRGRTELLDASACSVIETPNPG
jgi:hypothetical protein